MTLAAELHARFAPAMDRNHQTIDLALSRRLSSICAAVDGVADPVAASQALLANARAKLDDQLHISVNIGQDRLARLADVGVLPPTVPSDPADLRFRDNAEACFTDGLPAARPIYGALNWCSHLGGAGAFGPDIWLELDQSVLYEATYTVRDSYAVILPFLSDFTLPAGRDRLRSAILAYRGARDSVLDRYWVDYQPLLGEYIEAQVWSPVNLSSVTRIHVKTIVLASVTEIVKQAAGTRKTRDAILKLLSPFVP